MNHTLRSIAEDMGRDKRTVQAWYQKHKDSTGVELGELIDGTRCFTHAEREILIGYAGSDRPSKESPAIRPEVMPDNFIQSGQLAPFESREIQLPEGFNPAAMVKFFDGVTGQATDTKSLVAIADLAINAVESAMDQKIDQQRQQLTQAERDAEQLATKISEAKTKLQIKALESKILAERQTSTTKTAEQLFAELMSMGKPADSSATGDVG